MENKMFTVINKFNREVLQKIPEADKAIMVDVGEHIVVNEYIYVVDTIIDDRDNIIFIVEPLMGDKLDKLKEYLEVARG